MKRSIYRERKEARRKAKRKMRNKNGVIADREYGRRREQRWDSGFLPDWMLREVTP